MGCDFYICTDLKVSYDVETRANEAYQRNASRDEEDNLFVEYISLSRQSGYFYGDVDSDEEDYYRKMKEALERYMESFNKPPILIMVNGTYVRPELQAKYDPANLKETIALNESYLRKSTISPDQIKLVTIKKITYTQER